MKWINPMKGYAFVQRSSGEHILVRFSEIALKSPQAVSEGQVVEFEVTRISNGLQAEKVTLG